MVCGCKEHCIPSIEEAAKISSLVAPPIYLLKSQKYHIWYDPRCSPRSTHVPRHHADTTTTTTTTHDIDTTIELQRKHYTRARKVHNRRCSTSPLKNNNINISSSSNYSSSTRIPIVKSSTHTTITTFRSKLKHRRFLRSSLLRSSCCDDTTPPRCLTLTERSPTSSIGTKCPSWWRR